MKFKVGDKIFYKSHYIRGYQVRGEIIGADIESNHYQVAWGDERIMDSRWARNIDENSVLIQDPNEIMKEIL